MRVATRIVALSGALALTAGLAGAAVAGEETKLVVKGVHLCCGACERGVDEAVGEIEGADVTCDREDGTVAIVAVDPPTARRTLAALATAGYHGTTDHPELAIPPATDGVPEGRVATLTLAGFHNCCGACARAIETAIAKVEGVEAAKVAPRAKSCEVSGDFDARAVVSALHAAGFHARVLGDSK